MNSPPPLPPRLPPPLPPREDMEVTPLGFDKVEVRVGSVRFVLTRAGAFRLVGLLERSAAMV